MVSTAGSLLPGVVGVSPFQSCAGENHVVLHTVYCSKFNSLGIKGAYYIRCSVNTKQK